MSIEPFMDAQLQFTSEEAPVRRRAGRQLGWSAGL